MKVLFVNTTGGFLGGVEQNIVLTARGLSDRGDDVAFASIVRTGVEQRLFDDTFSKVFDLNKTPLAECVRSYAPDVIYLHKFDDVESVRLAAQGCRVVRMVHDHDMYCPRRHKYFFWNRHICSFRAGLVCYADLGFLQRGSAGIKLTSVASRLREMRRNHDLDTLIVGSRFMYEQMVKNGFSKEKLVIVPPTVIPYDAPRVPYRPGHSAGGPGKESENTKETITIMYVGQLIRGKGVDVLLRALVSVREDEACKTAQSEGVTLRCLIIGDGNDATYLRELAEELGIGGLVQFAGWQPHERIVELYDAAAVVVVPSRWPEPFGMVGIEAMLRARPVVASRVGGIPDWLVDGETGYLVPPDDPQALAGRIADVLTHPERARAMGEAGAVRARDEFGFDQYMERLSAILKGER